MLIIYLILKLFLLVFFFEFTCNSSPFYLKDTFQPYSLSLLTRLHSLWTLCLPPYLGSEMLPLSMLANQKLIIKLLHLQRQCSRYKINKTIFSKGLPQNEKFADYWALAMAAIFMRGMGSRVRTRILLRSGAWPTSSSSRRHLKSRLLRRLFCKNCRIFATIS
jgi:hypothetical protein